MPAPTRVNWKEALKKASILIERANNLKNEPRLEETVYHLCLGAKNELNEVCKMMGERK